VQWVGIAAAAGFYALGDQIRVALEWPISSLFALTAVVIVPVAVWFRPWRSGWFSGLPR